MHEDTEWPVYKKVQMAESDQNQKNIGKTKNRETKKTIFRESCLGPPPSKEPRNVFVFCFYKVFSKCGALQGNWHESPAKLSKCLWEWGVQ